MIFFFSYWTNAGNPELAKWVANRNTGFASPCPLAKYTPVSIDVYSLV